MAAPNSDARADDLPSLTGVRAIAAGAVFVDHLAHLLGATPLAPGWSAVRGIGIDAVLLFFVLSGYLLARPASLRGGTPVFLLRRAARIYPVYLLALALGVLAVLLRNPASPLLDPGRVLANLLLVQSWDTAGSGVSISLPAWSLSIEALFYLAVPFTLRPAAWLFRRSPVWSLAGLTVLAALGGEALRQDWVWATFPPAYLPVFYLGVHAAVTGWRGMRSLPAAVALALAAAAGYLGFPNLAVPALGFMVLVASLAARDRQGTPVLAGRGWQRAGVWSFAFFLMHIPVLQAVGALLPGRPATVVAGLGWSAVAFVLSWALAAVVYRVWEEPGRRVVLRRTTTRRATAPAAVSSSGAPRPATPRR